MPRRGEVDQGATEEPAALRRLGLVDVLEAVTPQEALEPGLLRLTATFYMAGLIFVCRCPA